ncbi:MAG: ATP-grasp domain-containing protein [candidate division NC10 bacterium]|nr:ATP-grasp domain-containing protein [candidate division NC10 bacterium]
MHRLLLLMTTTTYRAGAFLEAARRLDVPVVVGSDRPQVLAAANPAGNLTVSFLAPDAGAESIVKFTREYPIQAVIAADDDGVILAATASAALGLPHNPVKAVSAARNKHRMREVLTKAGILSPHFMQAPISEDPAVVAHRVTYPCVLKPLFLAGSRGVIRANGPAEFVAAFRRIVPILQAPEVVAQGAELADRILIEDFIPGVEVALEGLLSDGHLRVLTIYDKPDPLDGPFFEETIYVTPSRLPVTVQERITACTAAALEALGLRHGPIHAELRINDRGVWIIEIAARSIGGLCSRTLRFGAGISLEELILRHALGLDPSSFFEREGQAAGVMMIPIPQPGMLREVLGKPEAERVPGIEEIRVTIPVGQELVPLPEGSRYLGFIFARNETPERVEASLREAHRRLTFIITPPDDTAMNGTAAPSAEVEAPTKEEARRSRYRTGLVAGGSRRSH